MGFPTYILHQAPLSKIAGSLCLATFLATLEVSIIATSLVAITSDLRGLNQSSWLVTAYMLTYSGTGPRRVINVRANLMQAFSLSWRSLVIYLDGNYSLSVPYACSSFFLAHAVRHKGSHNCACLLQLLYLQRLKTFSIIFRAFQGIGGAGTYSLVAVIFFELVPPEKFAPYTSMVSGVFAFALLLGPLLGGIISNFTTWRWVFLLK